MECTEKRDFLVVLHTFLGTGSHREHARLYKILGQLVHDQVKAKDDLERMIIAEVAAKIAEIVRTDPYHSVRTAASMVLIRLGDPHHKDLRIENYLPGLLCWNEIHACTALNYVLEHFGVASLKAIFAYLYQEKEKYPAVLIRVLEAFCDDTLKRLDSTWARIQIESLCSHKESKAEATTRKVKQEVLPFSSPHEAKGLNERFVRIRSHTTTYAKGG
jgi:hypothetical protein